jgi:hypothetical protein
MQKSQPQLKLKHPRKAANSDDGPFPRNHNLGPPLDDEPTAPKQKRGGYYFAWHSDIDDPIVGIGQPVSPADPERPAYTRFEAWHWMRSNASFERQEIFVQGRPMTLNRGDLCGAYSYLGDVWNWSPKQVRGFVDRLVRAQRIEKQADELNAQQGQGSGQGLGRGQGTRPNVLSICDYDIKDELNAQQGQGSGQGLGRGQGNNINKINNNTPVGGAEAPLKPEAPLDKPQQSGGDAIPATPPLMTIDKVVWTHALGWLRGVYGENTPEERLRSRLGKMAKDHGVGNVLTALGKAQKAEVVDPLTYATEILVAPTRPGANRKTGAERQERDPLANLTPEQRERVEALARKKAAGGDHA